MGIKISIFIPFTNNIIAKISTCSMLKFVVLQYYGCMYTTVQYKYVYYLVDAGLLAAAVVSVGVSVTPLTVSQAHWPAVVQKNHWNCYYVHVKSANYDTHMYWRNHWIHVH